MLEDDIKQTLKTKDLKNGNNIIMSDTVNYL